MLVNEPIVNIAGTAQMYSQIAGVLAGFAFTALLGFLRHGASGESGEGAVSANYTLRSVTVVLFSTVTALIISAILYGILAGGHASSGNAFSAVAIDGPAFSLAILGMFYAIGLAATPYSHMDAMLAAVRTLVGVIGPAIAMILVATAALDIYHFKCGFDRLQNTCDESAQLLPNRPFGFGLALTLLGLITSIILWFYFRKPPTVIPAWIPVVSSFIVFGTSVIAVVGVVALTSLPASYVLSDGLLYALLSIVFFLLSTISLLTMWSCHPTSAASSGSTHGTITEGDGSESNGSAVRSASIGVPKGSGGHEDPSEEISFVTRAEIAARYGGYLADHYLALHVTVVSVALGVAGLAAASLIGGTRDLGSSALLYWLLWFASLLAVAAAYAGTMTGAIGLPARVPSMSDLTTPLLIAVVEVLLFGVLVSQIIGLDSQRAVITIWFFLVGLFGILAVVAIARARYFFRPSAYEPDLVGVVVAYRRRLKIDIFGAGFTSILGVVGGFVQLARSSVSVTAAFLVATAITACLIAAFFGHDKTARLWRTALARRPVAQTSGEPG